MSKGEIRFNEIKDDYIKHYERTNGKKLKSIYYKDGFVHIDTETMTNKRKISEFEGMVANLSKRPDFKPKENKKVAKLVAVSFLTRVVVDKNATQEEILAKAKNKFQAKLNNNELGENLEYIEEDTECPFDPETDKGEI